MADNNSYENKKNELIFHFNQIYKVCENKFTKGWGSYLFNGHSYEYDERMFEKQKLLFNLSKKSKSVLDDGVNGIQNFWFCWRTCRRLGA